MRKMKRIWIALPIALLTLVAVSGVLAWGGSEPVVMQGNPSCQDLGYTYGYKIEPVRTGVYWVPEIGEAGRIEIWTDDGAYVKWQTRFGTDIVIVKGGPGANVYYGDEEFWGVGFHAPVNPNNGKLHDVSHISFC